MSNYNPYYAPKPQAPSNSHLYPPSDGPGYAFLPPPGPPPGASNASGYKEAGTRVDYREVNRTPSPTPSEAQALSGKSRSCNLNIKKYLNPEYLKNPRHLFTVIATVVLIGATIAFVVLQNKIIDALNPAADWLRKTPGAWAIPIGVMIILSFPPLFGHELVALFCGDVWGVGIGFGIVAAGTLLGELCTYFAFRYCCRARAAKAETKNLRYALLSAVLREGGLTIAIMVRLSAIPAHLTTAIFATAGMSVWTFLIAAVLALPKQLATVYLGSAENSGAPTDENGDKQVTKTTRIIKIVVITVTIIITVAAMRYVNGRIDLIKERVIYERRKARQAKRLGYSPSPDPDADPEDRAPLVSHSAHRSDVSDATLVPSHADGHPNFAPPKSPSPTDHASAGRYDDPYAGQGVDLATYRNTRS